MPSEKVNLDIESLKVLASATRISILRLLDARCMTVTELSKKLDLSKATVYEHLLKMSNAGFVEKKDDTNKWVYYELTKKGREILHPHESTIFSIILSSTVPAVVGGVWNIYRFLAGTKLQYEEVQVEEIEKAPVEKPLLARVLAPLEIIHKHQYPIIATILLISATILHVYSAIDIGDDQTWTRSFTFNEEQLEMMNELRGQDITIGEFWERINPEILEGMPEEIKEQKMIWPDPGKPYSKSDHSQIESIIHWLWQGKLRENLMARSMNMQTPFYFLFVCINLHWK